MSKSKGFAACLAGTTAMLVAMQSANAAGFYIPEVGTPASVGTAGVANPTNTYTADAAWTNPAGMTGMTQDSILAGLMVSAPAAKFKPDVATGGGSDGGNAAQPGVIPSFFYTKVLSERSRLGFSVTAPFGGGFDYGEDFVGRYAVQKVSLAGLAFTPSYAYKVSDQLSLGIGVSFIYTAMEQEMAIRRLLPGPDGKAKFDGMEGWAYQALLGLTYQISSRTLLGVVYRSEADVDLEGTLKVEGLALPVADRDLRIQWDNPQWLEVGLRHQLNDRQTLFFNVGSQQWSAFSENVLSVDSAGVSTVTDRKWDNTWHVGVAYAQELDGQSYFTLGLAYESSPVKDELRTFDFPSDTLWKISGAYGWSGGKKLDFAVGATLYLVGDASIDQTAQGVRAAGKFDTNYSLMVGATMRYLF